MGGAGHLLTLADSISKLTLASVAHCKRAEERKGTRECALTSLSVGFSQKKRPLYRNQSS